MWWSDRGPIGGDQVADWHDFYVMAGGAAAALAGLILVALSLHLRAIIDHPLYRERALRSLQGLVTVLIVACAVLTPQPDAAFAIEIALLSVFWLVKYVQFVGLIRGARSRPRSSAGGAGTRAVRPIDWIGSLLWVIPITLSVPLTLAAPPLALYLLAFAVVAAFTLIVRNAWVLMVEVAE